MTKSPTMDDEIRAYVRRPAGPAIGDLGYRGEDEEFLFGPDEKWLQTKRKPLIKVLVESERRMKRAIPKACQMPPYEYQKAYNGPSLVQVNPAPISVDPAALRQSRIDALVREIADEWMLSNPTALRAKTVKELLISLLNGRAISLSFFCQDVLARWRERYGEG